MKIIDGEKEKEKLEIIKLSASAVKTYEQCPRKYFYTYIEKAKKKQWDHFDLGNLCHETLELFHQIYINEGAKKGSLAKLMGHAFGRARMNKQYSSMSDILLAEAKELCAGYLDRVRQDGMPNVKGVETSFNIKISNDVRVRGFLDRLDIMKDGRFHIVDYKTTKNAKYLDEFQLLVYGMWLLQQYPDIESFKGSYVLLRHKSKTKEYEFNREDVDRITKDLLNYASKIRSENTWTPVPTILCNWCDFKEICPAQKAW